MRLFVALNLPDELRQDLWRAAAPLRDLALPVKWVRPEGIHLTLKFLGEAAEEREPDLTAALVRAAGGTRPLTLAVAGFGAFPDARQPHVLWAGVEPEPSLELLQHRVEAELSPLGFPPEARPFHPHVTLGRVARGAQSGAFARLDRALTSLAFQGAALVQSLDLMQSTLQSGGAVYHIRHRARLS